MDNSTNPQQSAYGNNNQEAVSGIQNLLSAVGHNNQQALGNINNFLGRQDLEPLAPDETRFGPKGSYLPPLFAEQMEVQLVENRLVVISGNPTFQKNAFLRYLANRVLTYHQGLTIQVMQASQEIFRSVQDILSQEKAPTILVIDDVAPTMVLGNLIQVAQIAKSHGHFVIASSQQPLSKWGLKKELVGKLWYDVPAGRVVGEDSLIRHLSQRLHGGALRLRALTELRNRPDYEQLIGRAGRFLQSPEQCEAFIELLRYEEEPLDEQRFLELAQVTGGDSSVYMHIYHDRLPEKYKLLLMAAALFKGLNEIQFFDMADQLVANAWEYRAIELKALDYCDLEAIKEFYSFDRKSENSLLSSSYDQIDLSVLAESRFNYRRHLVKALKLITDTITTSGSREDVKDNTQQRRRLSESLSKLYLIARQDAEPQLRALAQSGNYNGQPNAAHAIAYLRELNRFELMLQLVDEWLGKQEAALQVAAMRALSLAARRDRPNHLDPEIKRRLIAAAKHDNYAVRNLLKEQMPRLLESHPIQMAEEIVQNILVQHDVQGKSGYFDPIAEGLSKAARSYPEDVWRLVNNWLKEAEANLDRSGKGQHTSGRDRLLIIALSTIQRLPDNRSASFPPYERILNRLTLLREKEVQPTVRAELMATILELLSRINQLDAAVWQKLMVHSIPAEQLELVEALGKMLAANKLVDPSSYLEVVIEMFQKSTSPEHRRDVLERLVPVHQHLRSLYAALSTQWLVRSAYLVHRSERQQLTQLIGQVYLFERFQFEGGDFTFEVGKLQLHSFMRGRPETQIERDMLQWIASEDRLLRKLGLLAFMEFGTLCDLPERLLQRDWVPPAPTPVSDPFADEMPGASSGRLGLDGDVATGFGQMPSGSNGPTVVGGRPSMAASLASIRSSSIPLQLQFWGCISVLFAPASDRKRFWQAVGTIHRKPTRYNGDAVRFSLQRIANSELPVTRQLAGRVRRLQDWLKNLS